MIVLDAETTGLNGYPQDKVLSICIYEINQKNEISEILTRVINYDIKDPLIYQSWIVQNGYLTLDEIANGYPESQVVSEVQEALKGKKWSSYNTAFDYDKFLQFDPWNLQPPQYCLMLLATKALPSVEVRENGEKKWLKLTEAYQCLFNKPMIGNHSVKNDTLATAEISKGLRSLFTKTAILNTAIQTKYPILLKIPTVKQGRRNNKIQLQGQPQLSPCLIHYVNPSDYIVRFHDLNLNQIRVLNIMSIEEIRIV
jgi:DNA polymerase III alpha subunit (gram-positive type)